MADQAAQSPDSVAGQNGTFAAHADPAASAVPHDVAEAPASPAAPVNEDLLGELARAMHLAATSQYERMSAELERRRADQVEEIGVRTSDEIDRLKTGSETDIATIDAWAKAETEKIKLERLRRIDARRERLSAELERQDSIKERAIAAIQVAIAAPRTEVDRFFGRMERETDPAAIAQIASTLPAFPALDEIAETARRDALAELPSLDADTAAVATATTEATSDSAAGDASATTDSSTPTGEAQPAVEAAEPTAEPTAETRPVAIPIEADSDARISQSRLMAVMAPGGSTGEPEDATPWEAPHAVTVAAGTSGPEPATEPEPPARMGSTLLRTVRAIRPMSGERHDRGGGDR
jgi:hypothetical protein